MAGPPFRRARSGVVVVTLRAEEVEVLRHLAGDLGALLEAPASADPVVERLFPRAYDDPTEQEAEREWQALAGPDLARERLDRLAAVVADLDAAPAGRHGSRSVDLDGDAVGAWLGVLNDVRLALAARLRIGDDGIDADADLAPDDPAAAVLDVYRWLTFLLSQLVEVLLDGD